jgi:CCR4-NOT transcriptional regulation complex NOT5 subunit
MEKQLVELVEQLKEALEASQTQDEELNDLVDQLDAYIDKKDQPDFEHGDDIRDTLLMIESRCSASHPVLTGVSEKLVEILSAMGI